MFTLKGKTKNTKDMPGSWGVWFCALDHPSVTATWGRFPAWALFLSLQLILSDSPGWLLSTLVLPGWAVRNLRRRDWVPTGYGWQHWNPGLSINRHQLVGGGQPWRGLTPDLTLSSRKPQLRPWWGVSETLDSEAFLSISLYLKKNQGDLCSWGPEGLQNGTRWVGWGWAGKLAHKKEPK